MKNCVYCAVELKDDATVCHHCGQKQPGFDDSKLSRSNTVKLIAGAILAIIIIAGALYFFTDVFELDEPCYEQASDYLFRSRRLLQRWDASYDFDILTLKVSTDPDPRKLRALYQEARVLDYPECVSDAHSDLLGYMNFVFEGFVFIGHDEGEALTKFGLAEHFREEFENTISEFEDAAKQER